MVRVDCAGEVQGREGASLQPSAIRCLTPLDRSYPFTFVLPFLAALDVTGRLAVPGALFAAAAGATTSATIAAALATAALALRGLVGGIAVEREVRRTFEHVIAAACRAPLLSAPREAEVALRLLAAAGEVAVFRAQVLPLALTQGLS